MSGGSTFLGRMADASRERVRRARLTVSEGVLVDRARAARTAPPLKLNTFDMIAELKLRSPAAGGLAARSFDRGEQLAAYARGGAAAVSVLTEPDEFHGSLTHLEEAAAALAPHGCPVMRKDFLTSPCQVLEARAAGAGGVLVIVTMLEDSEIRELVDCAREYGLFVLLEAFDRRDLERIAALPLASGAPQVLAGVNCRDLRDLNVRFERFAELAPFIPVELPTVAESGISSAADAATVSELGYELALVGSALMQSGRPEQALRDMLAAGRNVREDLRACS